jgi:hypothetical protein
VSLPSEKASSESSVSSSQPRLGNWVSQDIKHPLSAQSASVADAKSADVSPSSFYVLYADRRVAQRFTDAPGVFSSADAAADFAEEHFRQWAVTEGYLGPVVRWSAVDLSCVPFDSAVYGQRSPASIAGAGEAGAEKRSAVPDADEAGDIDDFLRGVLLRSLTRMKAENRALRTSGAEVARSLELQRRRIATLESVARIARAALQEQADRGIATPLPCVAEALRELAATLPDERCGVEASLADQPATPRLPDVLNLLNPQLTVRVEGQSAPMQTTLRAFVDANVDDDVTCALVRALEPGESVNLGGGAQPMFTVTRKAA